MASSMPSSSLSAITASDFPASEPTTAIGFTDPTLKTATKATTVPIKARVVAGALSSQRRSLLLVRTAERLDRTFPDWITKCFDDDGTYRPYDLNFPDRLPLRPSGGPAAFHNDPPITALGWASASLLGRGLRHRRIAPTRIYASPALRCVQTAAAIASGLGDKATNPAICVEPGLFEPLSWYRTLPAFLSVDELHKCGYPVSRDYRPRVSVAKLAATLEKETDGATSQRIGDTLGGLLSDGGGRYLVVAHAWTLDTAVRALDTETQVPSVGRGVLGLAYPYTASLLLQEDNVSGAWSLVGRKPSAPDPLPPLHAARFSSLPFPRLPHKNPKLLPAV